MSRVSKPSSTIGILASAAATIAAMTAYNVYRTRKVEREHPPVGQFVTVDGIRLHYIEKGEGTPVVLIHGNVVTAEDFISSEVLDLIAKRHRVIAFDRPGFGYSDRPHGSAWSAGTQADLIRDAFAVLGVAMLPLLLKGMFAPLPVPPRFTKSFPSDMPVRPGQIRAQSQDGVAMIPVALSMRHRYKELSMPIVIMAGAKDRVVKDSQAVRLHEEIPHSDLRLIPGVGHMVHYAVPDEVARAVEEAGKPATISRRAERVSGLKVSAA